jgi:acyl carrier protein
MPHRKRGPSPLFPEVVETIALVLADHGRPPLPLGEATRVLGETGLDSLMLAEVLVRLEDRLKRDPFAAGFVDFRTIGELARLYEA